MASAARRTWTEAEYRMLRPRASSSRQTFIESVGVIMTKGWKIAAVAIVVGVVTYVGLEILLPHHKVDVKLSGLVPADSVFSGTLQAPDAAAAAAAATPGSETADAGATTPSGPAVNTDDATLASGDNPDAGQTALVDTTASGDDESVAAVDAHAADTAVSAPASEPAPSAAVAAAKPASQPKPANKPAPAKPAAKKSVASTAKPASWWESSGNGLRVIYVGSAAFERAIVVMGNAPFANVTSASQNIRISDASGKPVAGSWKLGANNKSMLVFPVSKAGKFEVAVGAGLSDAGNRKLGQSLKGPVTVQ